MTRDKEFEKNEKFDYIYSIPYDIADYWRLEDEEFLRNALNSKNLYFVIDKKHNLICIVPFGNHLTGLFLILKNFYQFEELRHDEISQWQIFISENIECYNSMTDKAEDYIYHLYDIYGVGE